MKFSKKCCIGCMPAYNYGDCAYFNTGIGAPNENRNNLILNKEPIF